MRESIDTNDNLSLSKMSWKDHILMLKCGILVGDEQIGDFKCISWFYGQSKPYIRQQSKGSVTSQTLRERLKMIFTDIDQPFQVVYIDEYDDKIILPVDDVKESVTALQCFGYLSSSPIKLFIQLPDQKKPAKNMCRPEENKALFPRYEDSGLKIVETLNQMEKTIRTLGDQIIVLLEDIGKSSAISAKRSENDYKSVDEALPEEPMKMAVSQESATIKASGSDSDAESCGRRQSPQIRSSSELSTSSSSFSVHSHSGEDDWTRVRSGTNIGGRRRRFTTESSCASHQSDNSQDEVVRSIDDELSFFDMLCRNP